MQEPIVTYGFLALGLVLALVGWFWRRAVLADWSRRKSQLEQDAAALGRMKRKKLWATVLTIAGGWLLVERILQLVFGSVPSEEFEVSIWATRYDVGGYSLSETVITTWVIMAVVLVLALLVRTLVIPRMTDQPKGIQNVLEICVEAVCKFTKTSVGDLGDHLPSYLFALAIYMVCSAMVELLGVRAPTADITLTFAMAIITFLMINYFGLKKKGLVGRIKSMAKPTPVVFPIKIVSDLAVPVSLACRLFGNMLGGMIVMELLYMALGNAAIGFPSVLGLYFNVFHPLIQTYIFLTLTLTFIGEAVE